MPETARPPGNFTFKLYSNVTVLANLRNGSEKPTIFVVSMAGGKENN